MLPVRRSGTLTRYWPENRRRPTGSVAISGSGKRTRGKIKLFQVNTVVSIAADIIAGLDKGVRILQIRYQSEAPSR